MNAPPIVPMHRRIAFSEVDPTKWEFIITRAVRTAPFGSPSLSGSASRRKGKEARFSLIPDRTGQADKMAKIAENRISDCVADCTGSINAGQVAMSKDRFMDFAFRVLSFQFL